MADDGVAGREFPPWRRCQLDLQVSIVSVVVVEHFASNFKEQRSNSRALARPVIVELGRPQVSVGTKSIYMSERATDALARRSR